VFWQHIGEKYGKFYRREANSPTQRGKRNAVRTPIIMRLRDHGAPAVTTGFWRVLLWRPSTAPVKRLHLFGWRIRQLNSAATGLQQRAPPVHHWPHDIGQISCTTSP
jgi:hypothetical protein